MSVVKKYLRYPVTGEMRLFVIENKDDFERYKRYKANWEGWVPPGGWPAGSPELRSQIQRQMGEGVQAAKDYAPDIAAMAAGAGASKLPFLGRVAAQGLAGMAAAPIAGRDPAREGLNQGALAVPGEMLSGLTNRGALGFMRKGIDAAPELKASFGDIGGSALHERLGVANPTRISQGAEKAGLWERILGNDTGLTGSNAAAAKLDRVKRTQLLPRLASDPTTHQRDDVLAEVRRRLQKKIGKRVVGKDDAWVELDEVFDEAKNQNFATWDNTALWELKQGAQEQSVDLLRQINTPGQGDAKALSKAKAAELFNAEFQAVANERLAKIPGYKKVNDRYRELLGVKWAMEEAETGREATASARAVVGASSKPRVAFNPEGAQSRVGMTTAGRMLGNPVTENIARNLPRFAQMGVRGGDPTADLSDFLLQWQANQRLREQNPQPNRPGLPTDPAGPRP